MVRDITIDVSYSRPGTDYGQVSDPGGYEWQADGLAGWLEFATSGRIADQIKADHEATLGEVRAAALNAYVASGGNAADIAEISIDGPCNRGKDHHGQAT